MSVLASLLAGGAVALAVPAPSAGSAPSARVGRRARPGRSVLPLSACAAVAAVALLPGRLMVLGLVLVAVAAGAAVLLGRRRARLAAAAAAAQVIEACELLAAELGSGQPPGAALSRTSAEWPRLAPVAEAFRVGADVPAAWRGLSGEPGFESLRLVAAAWQVAHRTGHGLAEAVDRVAVELRAAAATRRVVDGELSSARSTARLMAALPAVALLMGAGVGGDPWSFLLGTPIGLGCLALGLLLGWAGLWWIEALAREVDRP